MLPCSDRHEEPVWLDVGQALQKPSLSRSVSVSQECLLHCSATQQYHTCVEDAAGTSVLARSCVRSEVASGCDLELRG